MFSLKADDIFDIVQPVHALSRLFGLTSFTINRKDGAFSGSKTWFNYLSISVSTAWSLFMGIIFYVFLNKVFDKNLYGAPNSFEKFSQFVMLAIFLITIFSNWWILSGQEPFCDILNLLAKVDSELSKLNVPVDLKKHKKFILIFIITLKVFTFLIVYATYTIEVEMKFFEPSIFIFIILFFVVVSIFLTQSHFILLAWALKLRYEKVNYFLKEKFAASIYDQQDGNRKISRAASIHGKLVEASEKINRIYSYPVILFNL